MSTEREMLESVERLKLAQEAGTAPDPVHYYWWPIRKLLTLFLPLLESLFSGDVAQMRTYEGLTPEGQRTLWICFYNEKGKWVGGFDSGFGCPPLC
jgi:hypothetical protein